jgi:hypothetical protein
LVNIEVTILRVNIHPDSSQYQANHQANDGGSRHLWNVDLIQRD